MCKWVISDGIRRNDLAPLTHGKPLTDFCYLFNFTDS